MSKAKTYTARIYLGRDEDGKQIFHWVGRYATKREARQAKAEAEVRLRRGGGDPMLPTCDEYAERYLTDYERRNKSSSASTQRQRLQRFKDDFAGRSIDLSRGEVKDWINGEGRWSKSGPLPAGCVPAVVSMFNHAIDEDDLALDRNPARKMSKKGKGRSDQPPPTEAEFQKLLDACSVLGEEYAPKMRALINFAAFSLMRPGELYVLEWSDIDFTAMRVEKVRRLYRGTVAEPKTGPKTIALTPPGRDALMSLRRDSNYVFTTKTGKRMSQGALSNYWLRVQAAAGLEFEFYLATKHYGVHYMWTSLEMSRRAIAAQAGWSLRAVDDLLAVYGHGDIGALAEVDAAFANHKPDLRLVKGGTQA